MDESIVIKVADRATESDELINRPQGYVIEPCLLPLSRQLLPSYQVKGWQDTYPPYLKKRVQRNPRDLHAHVQRTFLHLSQSDSEGVYAALVDLFLILGPRGRALRENLLGRARSYLSEERYRFLVQHLDCGLKATERMPDNPNTGLSKALSGTLRIVRRKYDDGNAANPVDLARECLRQKGVMAAKAILEDVLHDDPGNVEVSRELLNLYKKNQMRDVFFKTYSELFGRHLALPELWQDTELYFYRRRRNLFPRDTVSINTKPEIA